MKRSFLYNVCMLALLVLFVKENGFAQQDSLWVRGALQPKSGSKINSITLTFTDDAGKRQNYSAGPNGAEFSLRVPKQTVPVVGMLTVVDTDFKPGVLESPLLIFLNNKDIKIDGSAAELDLAEVEGDVINESYDSLRREMAPFTRKAKSISAPVLKGEVEAKSEEGKAIFNAVAFLNKESSLLQKRYIVEHPNSFVSLYLLSLMKNRYTSDDFAKAFEDLGPEYKQTRIALDIQRIIAKEAVTRAGSKATEFERTTLDGKTFHLSDLQGKVFLLDFWGSWCGPCRASMPHLKELHQKYKENGFEVVGVAQERGKTLEEAQRTWKKAVDELGIHWINVLNNENKEKMDIVNAYQVAAFPTKILVDKNGKIILRVVASATDDIDIKLKEIFGY